MEKEEPVKKAKKTACEPELGVCVEEAGKSFLAFKQDWSSCKASLPLKLIIHVLAIAIHGLEVSTYL